MNESLESIIDEVKVLLKSEFHLSDGSLKNYEKDGFKHIKTFYSKNNSSNYSDKLIDDCIQFNLDLYRNGNRSIHQFQCLRRSALLLREYYHTSTIKWKKLKPWNSRTLNYEFDEILKQHISTLDGLMEDSTIRSKKNIIKQFLFNLIDKGIKLSDISHKTIIDYLHYIKSCRPSGLNSVIPTIRSFLEYLYKNKLTSYDSNMILTIRNFKKTVVKPLIKAEEADLILSSIDISTNQGKRDYAIFTLAKYNGLRSSDILNIKLQDINWKNAEITIVQRKTNQALIVPINVCTGNSIADYILNSRPNSSLPYVFLKVSAPYNQLTSSNLCMLLKKYMKASGVHCTSNDWKSVHSFRRALGTNMLEANVPTSIISQVLGHKSPESIKAYLSLSDPKLSECPLDLSDIECEGLL